jgi:hypothetical protein
MQRHARIRAAVAAASLCLIAAGCFDSPASSDPNAHGYPPLNTTPFDRDLPAEALLSTVLQCGDTVYFFGGIRSDGRAVDSVWAFDLGSKRWIPRRSMPTARYYAGAVRLGGFIYVIGGRDRSPSAESADATERTVERYDPVADVWTTLPPITLEGFDGSYPIYITAARGRLFAVSSLRTARQQYLFESRDGVTWTSHRLALDATFEPTLMSDGDDLYLITMYGEYFAQGFYSIDPETRRVEMEAPAYDWNRGYANRWISLDGRFYALNGDAAERDVLATYDAPGTSWTFNDVPYDITTNRHFTPIITDRGQEHLYFCAPPQLRIGVHYAARENRFFTK